ncbi:hypothetical protein P691DRAFT_790553 [Macrolepiota fuliginosa MF-IS2]|uniref:Nephrocystin 3-like N-terminal domain-containing protein n=1 Tax=Macrolepiota fuliginosa MF-IS2 TaxID=1400762 RepID=A0A9P5X1F6_9AGAR|nr:hypothetical protein P691DRAFT_790553 [Macrolepiota fuliginosa MF-IS2]
MSMVRAGVEDPEVERGPVHWDPEVKGMMEGQQPLDEGRGVSIAEAGREKKANNRMTAVAVSIIDGGVRQTNAVSDKVFDNGDIPATAIYLSYNALQNSWTVIEFVYQCPFNAEAVHRASTCTPTFTWPSVVNSNVMPLFDGSQNTTITGGKFINQSIYHNTLVTNGQTGIDILLEASNPDAAHDSAAHEYDPRCHPGTREQHIEDIVYWAVPASGTDDPLPLFWMKGLAGVGKSAIAQTCAERLKELGKLGATFFFSLNGREKAAEFIPTIVYQLSTKFPDYRDLVDQRIRHDKVILDRIMATQFKVLIVEPLQELEKAGRGIGKRIAIIIDGLDECDSADAQCKIIELIASAALDGVTPFCWAFFSRPEAHIKALVTRTDVARVTCTTLLPISNDTDSDIELYLRNGFENILRRRDISIAFQWPSDNDIQTLVKASNGLFIYAATALRDVDQAESLKEALCTAIVQQQCICQWKSEWCNTIQQYLDTI